MHLPRREGQPARQADPGSTALPGQVEAITPAHRTGPRLHAFSRTTPRLARDDRLRGTTGDQDEAAEAEQTERSPCNSRDDGTAASM